MSTLEARFEAKVDRSGEHHLWTGSKRKDGAGQLKVGGRTVTAHRVAWELVHGPLPPSGQVAACPGEKACVRVEHLSATGVTESGVGSPPRRSSGAGSLKQLRPGVWKLTVTLGRYDDDRPRREYSTIYADNEIEAEREAAAFVAGLDQATLVETRGDRDLTTDEVVDQYLDHLRDDMGREQRTIAGYRDVYDKWWSEWIGQWRYRDVDRRAIDSGFGRMRRAGVGHSRMNQARSLLVPMARWAQDRRIIRLLPIVKGYELPKSKKTPKKRVAPEVHQLAAYLAAAVEVVPDVAPILTLIATSGMRRGESVVGRRNDLDATRQRHKVAFAADLDGSLKRTKTDQDREFALDPDTVIMLQRHFEQMDARAAAHGVEIAEDAFIFSLVPDCSAPMPAEYFTKQVAKLKDHLGIADKRPETIALEDEALRLFRQPRPPRPAGRRGPPPKGGISYAEIGKRLDRSEHWVKKALVSAKRREVAAQRDDLELFDGSIVALRKFSSSELLDAGFNVRVAADRQGHSPDTLVKHYSQRRRSADIKAAEHLGRLVHRRETPVGEPAPPSL